MIRMMIAISAQNTLDPHLENALNAPKAHATPIARIKSWTTLMLNGPILNVIPASNPLWIFFGYTTFILMHDE